MNGATAGETKNSNAMQIGAFTGESAVDGAWGAQGGGNWTGEEEEGEEYYDFTEEGDDKGQNGEW